MKSTLLIVLLLLANLVLSSTIIWRQGSLKNLMCALSEPIRCGSGIVLGPEWLDGK